MKAIVVTFDSLNRHMLPPYGCPWVHAPNFARLAARTVTFDNAWVGSMPCMPARREFHTGRLNFLHRSWGPIEPFDDSMPELLGKHGIRTHLVTDHYHYFEDGGCTYHTRYGSWEFSRGQEGDPWKCDLDGPEPPETLNPDRGVWGVQDWVNRRYMARAEDMSQAVTFRRGNEFIERNQAADNWLLHIETFDPHEPFYAPQAFKDLYPHGWTGPVFDWPPYSPAPEDPGLIEHMRYEYAALVSMCDHHLGAVLDLMDRHGLWDDTLLVVHTDHGFLLGEHGWWAKCQMPFYNEIARIPLFIWDPRCGRKDARCAHLVQTIDLAPTLLDYFNVPPPPDMQGAPLADAIAGGGAALRDAALFGLFGAQVNVTDGRYVYMRGPAEPGNQHLYEYTLMPTCHGDRRAFMPHEELATAQMAGPFSFTKGLPVMRLRSGGWHGEDYCGLGTSLYDLETSPGQEDPLDLSRVETRDIEARMIERMTTLMAANDAPPEQYRRLGLPPP